MTRIPYELSPEDYDPPPFWEDATDEEMDAMNETAEPKFLNEQPNQEEPDEIK